MRVFVCVYVLMYRIAESAAVLHHRPADTYIYIQINVTGKLSTIYFCVSAFSSIFQYEFVLNAISPINWWEILFRQ